MRLIIYIIFFCLFIIHSNVTSQENKTGKLAITGAFLIPMDQDHVVTGKTLFLEDGKIARVINAKDKIPSGYKTINAKGKYIMPGLSDMHIHLRDPEEMNSYVRYGVTTVLHMSGPLANARELAQYRTDIGQGKLSAPGLYFTSRNVEGSQLNFPSASVRITSRKDVEDFIGDAVKRKVDFIKMYETIDSELYFQIVHEATKNGLFVIGHTPRNIDPVQVLESGQKMIAHSEEFFFDFFKCRECGDEKKPDELLIDSLIRILKRNQIWVTPNLSFVSALLQSLADTNRIWSDPEVKYLPPAVFLAWQNSNPNNRNNLTQFKAREAVKYPFLQKLTKAFYKNGIPLLTGTDASLMGLPPGKSLIQDILEMNKAGIDNYGCLEAATKNPGIFINTFSLTGKHEFTGEIKQGYKADLLILDKNPLADLNNLFTMSAVILHGQYLTKQSIEQRRKIFR